MIEYEIKKNPGQPAEFSYDLKALALDFYPEKECEVREREDWNGTDGYPLVCRIDGEEVVQLYLRDEVGSVETPHMQLRGFKRIALKKGESAKVKFDLRFDDLALYNSELQQVVEPGTWQVMVGAASNDLRLKGKFEIK